MTQKLRILLACLGGIAAQAGWANEELTLSAPAPHQDLALAPHPGLATLACARCHAEIAAEWAVTQHAHAWIDPTYQEALQDKRRPESCHGCHIPAPLLLEEAADFGKKPLPRAPEEEAHDLGVSCQTCHAGPGGAMHGPFGAQTEAHASAKDERFSDAGSNALCAACHRTTVGPVIGVAKDFELAQLAERGQSCVGCHMAPLVRPIAAEQGTPAYPARAGRSHALQTPRDPAFLAQGFGLAVARAGGDVVLTIRNRAGHRVPGLVGRRLVFTAEALDASGALLAALERTVDDVAFLPVDGTFELRLAAPATALRVRGTHLPPESDTGIPFLAETLAVP